MSFSSRAALLSFVLVWPGQPIDDAARAWVQAHRTPVLEAPMRFASDRARTVLFAGGALALLAGPSGRAFVLESVVALLPVNLVVEGLKWGVNRTRPDGEHKRSNSSFPSSHAANAFTLAAVIMRRWRRAAIPAWIAATFVALSRVYLDRHWLSDVAFALPLGLGSAWLAGRFMHRRQATKPASTAS
jgi:membrane-associated phospholipid phosphatase